MSGVFAYSYYEYFCGLNAELNKIDEKLLITAGFSETLFNRIINNSLKNDQPVTIEDEYKLALKLQELADRMQINYVYGLTKRDGRIFFIASNPTSKEKSIDQYTGMFLRDYHEAPASVFKVFDTNAVQYDQYKDRWGPFRTAFFPYQMTDGQTYVIGVDVNIEQVLDAARHSFMRAFAYGLCLILLIVPLVFSYARTIHRHYQEKLKAVQMHPVTGLPNKRYMETELNKRENNNLVLLEIENFESIVNAVGVAATDSLLLKLTCHLQELDAENISCCKLYHLQDNHFALCGHDLSSIKQVENIASTVYSSLSSLRLQHQDKPIPLLVCMGCVFDQQNAFILARMALAHAKNTNQSIVMYDPSLDLPSTFQKNIEVLNQLTDALEGDRLNVLFQPIVDMHTGHVAKYEALARISDDDGNIVCLPEQFMPIAYQSRQSCKLTRLVLDKVINALKTSNHIVSINLSVADLFDHETRKYIIKKILQTNLGQQIEFEILEQQLICNYHLAAEYIKELKYCCRGIGMDDLGKHYSNFDRLLELPLDYVKIDGMIIKSIERDNDAKILVDGVIMFARKKDIKVIAEYCSSKNICDMVTSMGIDMLQGYYYGEPEVTMPIQS
ncbi:MAG: EAL domain-containing protein [Oceanicoccus sp.]|nr:EAL domain-containing protein [Oceanicoccus sp.]